MSKKKNKTSAVDRFLALPDSARARAAAEFDREFVADTFGRPPAKARALLRKAKRRGRPRIGRGAQRVLVTIERGLLARADRQARDMKITRSQLIAAGLQNVLTRRSA